MTSSVRDRATSLSRFHAWTDMAQTLLFCFMEVICSSPFINLESTTRCSPYWYKWVSPSVPARYSSHLNIEPVTQLCCLWWRHTDRNISQCPKYCCQILPSLWSIVSIYAHLLSIWQLTVKTNVWQKTKTNKLQMPRFWLLAYKLLFPSYQTNLR